MSAKVGLSRSMRFQQAYIFPTSVAFLVRCSTLHQGVLLSASAIAALLERLRCCGGTATAPMDRVSKQLVLSGKLKPEARLGLEISKFAQSLDDERREEFRRMQSARGNQISGWDVIKVTEQINQEGSRRHRKPQNLFPFTFSRLFGLVVSQNRSLQAPQQVTNAQ